MPQRGHAPRPYVNKLAFAMKTVPGPETERAHCLKRSRPTKSVTAHGRRRTRARPSVPLGCKFCFLLAIAEPLVRLDDRASI
nr:hypothetical protein BOSE7B_60627 [Bosea sp. 7B]